MTIGFLVLAAGRSSRFGEPKLLQRFRAYPSLLAATLAAIPRECPTAVVLSEDQPMLVPQVTAAGASPRVYSGISPGLGDSIAFGVRQTAHWSGWVLCLGDMPLITADVYTRVYAALDMAAGPAIAAPAYEGRRGHPVAFSHHFQSLLQSLEGDSGAAGIIRENSAAISTFASGCKGVLLDVDTPGQLAALAHQADS